MTDLWLACCVIKIWENSLSASVNLFKGMDVIDIHTKLFRNFCRFELSRVNLSHGKKKLVRVIGSFEKSRVREIGGEIIELEWRKSEGKQGLVQDIGRFEKPRVWEIEIPLYSRLFLEIWVTDNCRNDWCPLCTYFGQQAFIYKLKCPCTF